MDFGLQGTVALVVDSHLPIATAAAVALAGEGAILSLTAPDNYLMRHVEIELARLTIPQDRFRAVIADLDRERDIHRLVRETLHRQNDVGVLVNSFQELEDPASAYDLHYDDIEMALARNFFSSMQLAREVIPHMERQGMGRIINLIPQSAVEVSNRDALLPLSMAPLLSYFKELAYDLADENITVNNIIYPDDTPSDGEDIGTDFMGNQARSQDWSNSRYIGDIVAMIASEQASRLTGADIFLDGHRRSRHSRRRSRHSRRRQ